MPPDFLLDHARADLEPVRHNGLSRSERLVVYKDFIEREEARIRERHDAGDGGCEVASLHARLIDIVIESLFNTALFKCPGADPIALVANGGYGRGLLNPSSDVDLLFLLSKPSNKLPKDLGGAVEEVLYLLWDCGFRVGHATRSIPECIRAARSDPIIRTSLFDDRLLAGHSELFAKFKQRFRQECIDKDRATFFKERREDIRQRYRKHSSTVFLQEPNLKESPGGMRDYHNLLWISDALFQTRDLRVLQKHGRLSSGAVEELEDAFDFLHRLRNALHYHTGRATDILTLRLQGVVVDLFEYQHPALLRRIENLMRDYYRHARNIHQYTHSIFEIAEIETDITKPVRLPAWLPLPRKTESFDGFTTANGRLEAAGPDIFDEDPARLLRLFLHCQQRAATPAPSLRKLIKANWQRIDKSFCYAKSNRETFRTILEHKGQVGQILRLMHRCGVLGRYIPEFGALDCLVQHEFFHRYTADEHTLRCIEELDALLDSDKPPEQRYRQLFIDMEDPYAFYLALLLHDSGRAENVRQHIDGSAHLANRVCRRLQISGGRRRLIMFLVDHHLTLWRYSTQKNIDDPDVVAGFAAQMKERRLLDSLLLFTFADSRGTNEEAWSPWKETLILQLYRSTLSFLKQGYTAYDHAFRLELKTLQRKVTRLLPEHYARLAEEHFARMPKRYFRFRDARSVSTHIRAVWQYLDRCRRRPDTPFEAAVQWIEHPDQGYTELTVVTHDRPLLLEKISCALASHEINILSADIYTRPDGVVLDIFRVVTLDQQPVQSRTREMSVVMTLYQLAGAEEYQPDQYLQPKPNLLRDSGAKGIPFPVRAYLDNNADPQFTVIEIQAIDRIGLLHDLLHTINQHGLQTIHARIATEKGAALDTLYVQDRRTGAKLQPECLHDLREALDSLIGAS